MQREKFEIPVNEQGLVRDSDSKALLASDKKALELFRLRQKQKNKIDSEMDAMKNEMNDIKKLLTTIINKLEEDK